MKEPIQHPCCYIDPETERSCEAPAAFHIYAENPSSLYDTASACEAHVGALLGSCNEYPVAHWHVCTVESEREVSEAEAAQLDAQRKELAELIRVRQSLAWERMTEAERGEHQKRIDQLAAPLLGYSAERATVIGQGGASPEARAEVERMAKANMEKLARLMEHGEG